MHGARTPSEYPRAHTAIVFLVFHLIYLIGPLGLALLPFWLVLSSSARAWQAVGLALPAAWYALSFDGSERRLGKPWPRFCKNGVWSFVFSWFPITIEKPRAITLDAAQTHIFAVHPHGCLAFNRAAFGFDVDTLWNSAFPGVDFRVLTASAAFRVPLIREMWLWSYCVDASKATARRVLAAKKSILVYPGGEREQILTQRGEHVLYLLNRKGFIKLALETGSPLVPMYAFGDTDLFVHHSLFLGARKWLVRKMGVAIPLISGSIGLLPYRVPVRIVVGQPLRPPAVDGEPSQAQIDSLHALYVDALRSLFEQHKARCGHPDAALVIT